MRRCGTWHQGTKATPLKRLEEHAKKNAAASASANEEPSAKADFECDAVLERQFEIGVEAEMRQRGKDALQQELDTHELEIE